MLVKAVVWRQEDIVRALLANGADVNASDRHGARPLWYAAGKESTVEIACLLLDGGADVNAAASTGEKAG